MFMVLMLGLGAVLNEDQNKPVGRSVGSMAPKRLLPVPTGLYQPTRPNSY